MSNARRFTIEISARSRADAATIFALETDGARWSTWARPLVPRSAWERQGDPPPGGVGAVRLLGLRPLWVREETMAYEQDRRHEYLMLTPMPIRDYRAELELTPVANGTDVVWRGSFEERIPWTGPVFRVLFRALLSVLLKRLLVAAEARTP
jgi:Polyketide cyclase / dehydrase and lipid transport